MAIDIEKNLKGFNGLINQNLAVNKSANEELFFDEEVD